MGKTIQRRRDELIRRAHKIRNVHGGDLFEDTKKGNETLGKKLALEKHENVFIRGILAS